MKILIIGFWFPPANVIGAIRLGKLARYLDRHGHDVRVLTTGLGDDRSFSPRSTEGPVIGGVRVMRKLLGVSLITAVCLVSIGSNGDPAPADKAAVCASQPQGPGGLPLTLTQWAEGARPFEGLGNFHRTVTTGSPAAQGYFDQGMRFLWAFNHDEATRSFAKAAELDPQCAMCYWGVSLTVGPNYNLPIMARRARLSPGRRCNRRSCTRQRQRRWSKR
jgi:hypothetical protein